MNQELDNIINGCKMYNAMQQEALYKYCYKQMFAVCERYTVNRDDAAVLYNEAMLKVFTNIEQYEYKGAFLGWVQRIMVNTCIDSCRKKTSFLTLELDEKFEDNIYVTSEIENRISSEEIIIMIKELPKNTSLVFNMYAIEGWKFEDIATELNITIGTAKWHVSEARKTLKQKLNNYNSKVALANG